MFINDSTAIMNWGGVPFGSDYTRLQYLESNGTAWLNTGLILNGGTPFKIKFRITSTANPATNNYSGMFGARTSNTTGYGFFYFRYQNVNYVTVYTNGNEGTAFASSFIGESEWYGHDVLFEINDQHQVFFNNNYARTITIKSFTGSTYSYLFKWNYSNATTVNTYRIYEFEVPNQRHMIPAMRNSDGVVGMYDVVQKIFRTNQGTGSFTYG